jgi:hypothetical protein
VLKWSWSHFPTCQLGSVQMYKQHSCYLCHWHVFPSFLGLGTVQMMINVSLSILHRHRPIHKWRSDHHVHHHVGNACGQKDVSSNYLSQNCERSFPLQTIALLWSARPTLHCGEDISACCSSSQNELHLHQAFEHKTFPVDTTALPYSTAC